MSWPEAFYWVGLFACFFGCMSFLAWLAYRDNQKDQDALKDEFRRIERKADQFEWTRRYGPPPTPPRPPYPPPIKPDRGDPT